MAYIDGFNLYYGLKNACRSSDYSLIQRGGDPSGCIGRSLYWLDVRAVIESEMRRGETCVGVKYFSAPRRLPELVAIDDAERDRIIASNERQRLFLEATEARLQHKPILGWYAEKDPHECPAPGCGTRWAHFEEKGTDVNIATHLIVDAYENQFDVAIVMSADADLVAPIQAVQKRGKRVRLLLPPGRKRADALRAVANESSNATIKSIRKKMMPDRIDRAQGLPPIERPPEWGRPNGWVWGGTPPLPKTTVVVIANPSVPSLPAK